MGMADIGGPLAHQLPLHSHRGGLVQPSLVMNHHLELDCHGHEINISECLADEADPRNNSGLSVAYLDKCVVEREKKIRHLERVRK